MIDRAGKYELVLTFESEVPRSVVLHVAAALEAQEAVVGHCATEIADAFEGWHGGEEVIEGILALAEVLRDMAVQARQFHLALRNGGS